LIVQCCHCFFSRHLLTTTTMLTIGTQGRARPKSSLVSQGLATDVLGALVSIAEAVPVLGAPVKGSLEALKQIIQYTKVSSHSSRVTACERV
jgi:hypothetical protein